jgi:LysR substrate binding domain
LRFYERVKPSLATIEEAAVTASGAGDIARGRLRVNMDPVVSRLMLAGRLGVFLDRHPEISLEFITREQIGDLVGDGVDVAIRFGEPAMSSGLAQVLSGLYERKITMENLKLGTRDMEISSTTGLANLAWGKVTQARNRMVLVLCGVLGLGLGLAKADNDAARPVKNLDEANGQIHWPEEMTPKKADSFVHNEIFYQGACQRHLVEPGESEGLAQMVFGCWGATEQLWNAFHNAEHF